MLETSPRIQPGCHEPCERLAAPPGSPAPLRSASVRDAATTAPRRPLSYQHPVGVSADGHRKMRPADDCKPNCQRRVPVRPVPTASRRGLARPDSMRRAVHAVAVRFGSPLRSAPAACLAPRLPSRLASDASSPTRCELNELDAHRIRQDRLPRRPVKGGSSCDPKRLQPTSEP